jgi:hypothetical protein
METTAYVYNTRGLVRWVEHVGLDGERCSICLDDKPLPFEHAEALAVDVLGIDPTPYGLGVSFELDVE